MKGRHLGMEFVDGKKEKRKEKSEGQTCVGFT